MEELALLEVLLHDCMFGPGHREFLEVILIDSSDKLLNIIIHYLYLCGCSLSPMQIYYLFSSSDGE